MAYYVLIIMLVLEHVKPYHPILHHEQRWLVNFFLFCFSTSFIWIGKIIATAYIAPLWQLNYTLGLLTAQFIMLDVYHYAVHRLFHHYKILWATHVVHHSDIEVDVTTEYRHHPFEVILNFTLFAIFSWAFAIQTELIAFYATCAVSLSIWHHSNFLPPRVLDQVLAYVIITPRLHHLHHVSQRRLTDSNYGMIFSIWDRLFNTFSDEQMPTKHDYGLNYFNKPEQINILFVLKQPVKYLRQHNKHRNRLSKKIDSV